MDLEIFDKKYRLAKDEAFDLRGAIKRLEGRDFDDEIREARQTLFLNEAKNLTHKNSCTAIKKKIKKEGRRLKKLKDKIDAVPAEPIDIDECLAWKERYALQRAEIEERCEANTAAIEENNLFIEKAKKFLRDFDVEALEAKSRSQL